MPSNPLLEPGRAGAIATPNRIVMAPLTRSRADEATRTPHPLAARYYAQRASAAFIVTEATQVSPQGIGYPGTPGIHSDAQIEAWSKVTEAVHAAGGRIVCQLWHVGRISHSSMLGGALPVAPSAVAAKGEAFTLEGARPFETPLALSVSEIRGVVDSFREAAIAAKEAGFDGVEVHGANGYLLDQFLRDGANRRTDAYGGSAAKRARLLVEVTEAASKVWGAERVGVRLSPFSVFNDLADSDEAGTFLAAVRALSHLRLAYLHVVRPGAAGDSDVTPPKGADAALAEARAEFAGAFVLAGGFDAASAEAAIRAGAVDYIAFGRAFLANPDLPERIRRGAALNEPDRATFYGGDGKGYVDYPRLDEAA